MTSSSKASIGPRRRCGTYFPGHDVHHEQARKSLADARPVQASVTDDGWIAVSQDGADPLRYWNHDPDAVAEDLEASGGVAELRVHHVLAVPVAEGQRQLFNLANHATPCGQADPTAGAGGTPSI